MNATTVKPGDTLKTSQLQLADRILSLKHEYTSRAPMAGVLVPDAEMGIITVKNVTADEVTLFRPYTHTADFSSTGGVICYVGVEEWKVEIDRDMSWHLIRRTELR